MALTQLESYVFRELAKGNFSKARYWLQKLAEDKTSKQVKGDSAYFAGLLTEMNKNIFVDIPVNIQGLIHVEDPSCSFILHRYVPSDDDLTVLSKMENAYRVRHQLCDLHIDYLNGAIFYGSSGCGKTALGRYLSARLHLPFVFLDFSSVIDSLLGKTSSKLKSVFEFVNKQPCVFMIDEADAIGMKRQGNDGSGQGEMNRVVISLMQLLDCFDSNSILLFATNRFDMLDNALLRRIPIHYEIKPMDQQRRIQMVAAYLSSIPDAVFDSEGICVFLQNFSEDTNNGFIINSLIQWIVENLVSGLPIRMCASLPEEASLFEDFP